MRHRTSNQQDQIDRTTSASICSAIGERLRRSLVPEDNVLPGRLQHLLDEMQRQDRDQSTGATA